MREKGQITGLPQVSQPLFADLLQLALTRDGAAEIGVIGGYIASQIASTAADGTDFLGLST